jgi:hypothetical protein
MRSADEEKYCSMNAGVCRRDACTTSFGVGFVVQPSRLHN